MFELVGGCRRLSCNITLKPQGPASMRAGQELGRVMDPDVWEAARGSAERPCAAAKTYTKACKHARPPGAGPRGGPGRVGGRQGRGRRARARGARRGRRRRARGGRARRAGGQAGRAGGRPCRMPRRAAPCEGVVPVYFHNAWPVMRGSGRDQPRGSRAHTAARVARRNWPRHLGRHGS
jgi:hypothetical protein